jgi:pyruvate/2-oxoglutarate dehydrogenase complex dihydrolipoamide dehydrogenase (E3) component
MRASARVAHLARRARRWGVETGEVSVDLAAVVARKDEMIGTWRDAAEQSYTENPSLTYLHGWARFAGTVAAADRPGDDTGDGDGALHVVDVTTDAGNRRLSAARVILNTGARSVPPPIDGLDTIAWLDHHSILDLTELPSHLVVIGGSYIGLEFGQMFSRFGSEVTIVEQGPRLIGREDVDITDAIEAMLADEDIDVRTGVAIERVRDVDGAIQVELAGGDVLDASHVLVAAGRIPNSDDLGLDTVGVSRDEHGYVTTDDVFATDVAGIYAVGDVNGRGAFTHTSYQDFEILADHLAGGDRTVGGRTTTYALFTDPPLGRVGITEAQAVERDVEHSVVTFPAAELTKAVLDGETHGLVRLVVDDRSGQFLGAAAFCLHGDEIVQIVSMMMHAGVRADAFATWLPIHPTVAEFLPTILGQLQQPD